MPVALAEGLDGRFVIKEGGHDVAVDGVVLTADHHPVAVADRGIDHRVTSDFEHEQFAVANQLPGERDDVLDGLIGEDRAAGRDPSYQGHHGGVTGSCQRGDIHAAAAEQCAGSLHPGNAGAAVQRQGHEDFHGTRSLGITAEVTKLLQLG